MPSRTRAWALPSARPAALSRSPDVAAHHRWHGLSCQGVCDRRRVRGIDDGQRSDVVAFHRGKRHAIAIHDPVRCDRAHPIARRHDTRQVQRIRGADDDQCAISGCAPDFSQLSGPRRATRTARRSVPKRIGRPEPLHAIRAAGTHAPASATPWRSLLARSRADTRCRNAAEGTRPDSTASLIDLLSGGGEHRPPAGLARSRSPVASVSPVTRNRSQAGEAVRCDQPQRRRARPVRGGPRSDSCWSREPNPRRSRLHGE